MDLMNVYVLEQRAQQQLAALHAESRRDERLREARQAGGREGARAPFWLRFLTAMLFW